MFSHWTVAKKLTWGLALIVAITALAGGVAVRALYDEQENSLHALSVGRELAQACELETDSHVELEDSYYYLLSKSEPALVSMKAHDKDFADKLVLMRKQVSSDEGRRMLTEIERIGGEQDLVMREIVEARRAEVALAELEVRITKELEPRSAKLDAQIEAFIALEREELAKEAEHMKGDAVTTRSEVIGAALLALLAAVLLGVGLTRGLTTQIGAMVVQLQSATAELQAAAAEQATGTKEQATATSEVSTTLKELVATARQIGESAQHVVQLAENTRGATRVGDQTGARAQEAVALTKRQVDLVVSHMLDLGKKSQQIGNVLEIINELSEQTNILSINATIEAAGAGDAGKRFGSVADEIRKLADRTATSTKVIRTLIEEIRAGVNTTVMATETGSKAADASARQLTEVTTAFGKIGDTVVPTTEAAREIELSTKQQTSAVEQVNVAVASVAQAAKESEVATTQTLQAAAQLGVLAKDLTRLIRADAR